MYLLVLSVTYIKKEYVKNRRSPFHLLVLLFADVYSDMKVIFLKSESLAQHFFNHVYYHHHHHPLIYSSLSLE